MNEVLPTAQLGDLATITMGQSPDSAAVNGAEVGLPFLQGCAEFGARFPLPRLHCSPPLRVAKSGSILISVRAPVGTTNRADQDYCIGRGLGAVLAKPGIADDVFLLHAIEANLEFLHRRSQGSTFLAIGSKELSSLPVPAPGFAVQRRIAEILSTLDEAIEQTEALIAKHQQIKVGLMHDLFTRGVTPDGHLRPTRDQAPGLYKESPFGWIPKEWEVKPLSAVVEFLDGKRVPLKEDDRSKIPGHIPYYGASGIIDYIDKWLFDDELILLGEDGENIVSRNLPLAFKVNGKCWVNNHAHVLKPKAGHSISYWTEQLEWKDYASLTSGSAQPKITQGKLTNMMVVVPSLAEQKVISKRAEYMADHLAAEKTFWGKLKLQKHGLMHDLLTGRVRVRPHPGTFPAGEGESREEPAHA